MAQPVLSIKSDDKTPQAVVNLLPCRIHHNGPVDPAGSYWNPTTADDGTKVAYFRGRKLQGKVVKLPEQCRGVVVERREDESPAPEVQAADSDDVEEPHKIGTMEATASFDEMVVWGHEATVVAAEDPYVRSMEEWLQVADQIHSFSQDEKSQK